MILDGKELSKKRKEIIEEQVIELKEKYHITPKIAVVLVGDNPASQIYVRNKLKAAEYCQIDTLVIRLNENISMEELLKNIDILNNDDSVHGIIVQLPLPKHIDEQVVIDSINENKDVDGFGVNNKGRLFCGLQAFAPATPSGIMNFFNEYNIQIDGKEVVVLGRSNIVGKPMAMLMLNENATVTIAHSHTTNLEEVTKRADILIVAIRKANLVKKSMVKNGAVIIDVGINRIDGKIYGDVDFDDVKDVVSYITPVPGGVGPMTIASLLENTVKEYIYIMENKRSC